MSSPACLEPGVFTRLSLARCLHQTVPRHVSSPDCPEPGVFTSLSRATCPHQPVQSPRQVSSPDCLEPGVFTRLSSAGVLTSLSRARCLHQTVPRQVSSPDCPEPGVLTSLSSAGVLTSLSSCIAFLVRLCCLPSTLQHRRVESLSLAGPQLSQETTLAMILPVKNVSVRLPSPVFCPKSISQNGSKGWSRGEYYSHSVYVLTNHCL